MLSLWKYAIKLSVCKYALIYTPLSFALSLSLSLSAC